MTDITIELIQKATLSGLAAAVLAIGVTRIIEYFGGIIGGIMGTLPTTIIPASLGLWAQTNGGESFNRSLYAVPAGMCLNALFLYLWRVLPPYLKIRTLITQLLFMSLISLSMWAVGAYIWVHFAATSSDIHRDGFIALVLIILIGLYATWLPYPAPKGQRSVGLFSLISRGVFAGIAVGSSVLISALGDQTLAGIASVFPAIFWTAMLSLWMSQGQAVPAGAVGPMMLGSSSVAVYALCAPSLFNLYGAVLGALSSFIIAAFCAAIPSYLWINRRIKYSNKGS